MIVQRFLILNPTLENSPLHIIIFCVPIFLLPECYFLEIILYFYLIMNYPYNYTTILFTNNYSHIFFFLILRNHFGYI